MSILNSPIKAPSINSFLKIAFASYVLTLSLRFFASLEGTRSTLELSLEEYQVRTLRRSSKIRKSRRCDPHILEERDSSRIPGYIEGCNSTYYGYVMRDFAARLLPTTLSKSIVLVVAPGASIIRSELERQVASWEEEDMRKKYKYAVGDSFVIAALKQGQHVVGIDGESEGADHWWTSTSFHNQQERILLAVFDPVIGQEDTIVENASQVLGKATVDYIVFQVSSKGEIINGIRASNVLLSEGYRLQILSASHASRTGENQFGPNTLLRDQSEVESYLMHGAELAANTEDPDSFFLSYIFATKGLDLAIPSRHEYINVTAMEGSDPVIDIEQVIPYKRCPNSSAKVHFAGEGKVRCQSRHSPEQEGTDFDYKEIWYSGQTIETSEAVCVRCIAEKNSSGIDNESEIACSTRFIPTEASSVLSSSSTTNSTKPNILVITIEQVSRERFEKSLPLTKALLTTLELRPFNHYTSVGNSTSFNQAALFKGARADRNHRHSQTQNTSGGLWLWDQLQEAGYATLKAEDGCHTRSINALSNTTYGGQLHKMFCYDFSRSNCLGNAPAAEHMISYSDNFIRHHRDRKKPWAAFISFIDGHEDTGTLVGMLDSTLSSSLRRLRTRILAAEWDNTAIIVVSDGGLNYGSYAQSLNGLQETVQPVLYIKAASRAGDEALTFNRNMYTTPFDMHKTLLETAMADPDASGSESSTKSTSPGQSLLTKLPKSRLVCSETPDIPDIFCDRMHPKVKALSKTLSLEMPSPPSILSFYADIPKTNRRHIETTDGPPMRKRAKVSKGCICATNIKTWFPCDKHPWSESTKLSYKEYFILVECPDQPTHYESRMIPNDFLLQRSNAKLPQNLSRPFPNILFIEVDSVSEAYADRHFPKTRELLQRFRVRRTAEGYDCSSRVCSADFSSRVSLVGANSVPNQVAALAGCVASSFDQLCGFTEAVVGLVCKDPIQLHFGLQIHRVRLGAKQAYWCPPQSQEPRRTPWLFGLSDSLGYLNYFGEEFCFEGSPYVTQGNVFPAFFADIEPHRVFCRLAEQRIRRANITVFDEFRWSWEKQDEPCIDGFECGFEKARISLDLIEKMWDTYPDRPKLAFLNAMAAHVYDPTWEKLYTMAERYDDHLFSFLESMLSREDSNSTIIIVRSDHGMQRGHMAMDYSTQVEHTRPWTEILVPESLPGLSKSALFQNQDRLTSGFDLYHTLRALMTVQPDGRANEDIATLPLPDWTFDLLTTSIPENRTCKDAKLDPDLCREDSIVPNFGVCNSLDKDQKRFCRDYQILRRGPPLYHANVTKQG